MHAWLNSVDDASLHLAAVTLAEIQAGIEIKREQDPVRAMEIESWLDLVSSTHQILAMDGPAFRCWVRLMHRQSNTLYEDAMIAAIARGHDFTVVTRNTADFRSFGVKLLDPFSVGSL